LAKLSGELEPSTPSLPWKFRGVTRVHARSLGADFRLQIGPLRSVQMRRERSRVSFLMCPFCVRGLLPNKATSRRSALYAAVGYANPVMLRGRVRVSVRSLGRVGAAGLAGSSRRGVGLARGPESTRSRHRWRVLLRAGPPAVD